jgi:hypothetical protein
MLTNSKNSSPLILEGADAEVLRTDSLKIAADLMGERRKVLAGLHVDVSVLDNGADTVIKVDDIRTVRRDALLRPFDGEVKVYIIAHAHRMNQNAQNALLKILEEPPRHARFILLAKSADMLLPTIRSRCAIQRTVSGEQRTGNDEGGDLRAKEFVKALENPWKRAEVVFSWEKFSRDALKNVLLDVLAALSEACLRDGCKPIYLDTIKTVSGLIPSLELNASPGSVCGVLAINEGD